MGISLVYKILLVFGTRPEAIKMAPLVKKFQEYPDFFETKVCVTAQHRQMLDQALKFFDIIPDYDLDIMEPNQDLSSITSTILVRIKPVLTNFKPNVVLVHGDTTTSFVSSLASFYQKIPVGHVEAGLRTNDKYSPFPEELNRQLTGVISAYNFSPTLVSRDNLLAEKKPDSSILVTGNTVIDALLFTLDKINKSSELELLILERIKNSGYDLGRGKRIVLITAHRRENHGHGLENICEAVKSIAQAHENIDIVFPVHPNPKIKKVADQLLATIENVHLISPLSYEDFVYLMDKSYFLITDSGGIQEEAPSLKKPVLVMRESTERPEALAAGTIMLVGSGKKAIIDAAELLLIPNSELYTKMSNQNNPYGDGKASERIVSFFKKLIKQ